MTSPLILPGDPLFEETLLNPSPLFYQERDRLNGDVWLLVDPDNGLLRVGNEAETIEYLYGGEYEARLNQFGESMYDETEDDLDCWEDEEDVVSLVH